MHYIVVWAMGMYTRPVRGGKFQNPAVNSDWQLGILHVLTLLAGNMHGSVPVPRFIIRFAVQLGKLISRIDTINWS
jgi:hypothetical protein